MAATGAGGSEGFSSHRAGQRPQGLQEAAQDENQRAGALHQDRSEKITTHYGWLLFKAVDFTRIYTFLTETISEMLDLI